MRARRGIVEILRAHCYWRCMAPDATNKRNTLNV